MAEDKKSIPKDIWERMLQDDLDKLLLDHDEFESDDKKFDPYSLDSNIEFIFENKFINGIKKLPSASRPLRSAYRDKLISEIEVMRQVNKNIELGALYTTEQDLVKVLIPGAKYDYYLKTSTLKNLLKRMLHENSFIRSLKNGSSFMAVIIVDLQFLLENCIRRK